MNKDDTESALETIREYSKDIDRTKEAIKEMREQASEMREAKSVHEELVELETKLKTSRKELELELQGDRHYNELMENIAQEGLTSHIYALSASSQGA